MHVDIERQLCPLMSFAHRREYVPQVTRDPGDAQKPGLLIQDSVDVACVEMMLAHQEG
jgi:hypothetical protein